jgi:large subunit ribosomal protein LX
MKAFRAVGTYLTSTEKYHKRDQPFSIEVAGKDEEDAKHTVYSNIGSRHRVIRSNINITEMKPLSKEEVTDPVVKHLIGG